LIEKAVKEFMGLQVLNCLAQLEIRIRIG